MLSLSVAAGAFGAIVASLNRPEATLIAVAATLFLSISLQLSGLLGEWKQVISLLIFMMVATAFIYPRLPHYDVGLLIALFTALCSVATINLLSLKLRQLDMKFMESARVKTAHHSRLDSLTLLSSSISHEIRNPLTIIEGYANQIKSLATQDLTSVDKNIYMSEKIIESSERIAKILHTLRQFSHEEKEGSLKIAPLSKILKDCLSFYKVRFNNKNIQLDYPNFNPNIFINCRPSQIAQVFLNLLNNAFESVMATDDRWVRVNVEEKNSSVLISFTNSGQKISPQVIEKILKPSYSTKDINYSSELNLSICISLIKDHNGDFEIDANSEHNGFIVKLPKLHSVKKVS